MSLYTIAQLAELSGIKPHTIRIWEKRYNLLMPERTNTNIRRYDDSQLRRLLNTVTLLNSGVKISTIASYTEKEINELIDKKIEEHKSPDSLTEILINKLFAAGIIYDEAAFEKVFNSAIEKFGVKQTYIKIIYPLLVRAGFMWLNTSLSPSQEHFASNLIRRKLFSVIDSIPLPTKQKQKWILFLPENEYHEIGLLFAYYLIRSAGHSVVYLGTHIPYGELVITANDYNPTHILFFSVHKLPKSSLQRYIKTMESELKKISIVVSADSYELKTIKPGKNVHLVSSVEGLEKLL